MHTALLAVDARARSPSGSRRRRRCCAAAVWSPSRPRRSTAWAPWRWTRPPSAASSPPRAGPPTTPSSSTLRIFRRRRRVVASWPDAAERLARRFWPGPLTLVVPRGAAVPDATTAGGPTVAVRVPAHPVALALLRATDAPIAAPSANRSGELSPTRAEHVLRGLDGRIDLVLDAGPTTGGVESTVVDVSNIAAAVAATGPDRAGGVGSGDRPRRSSGGATDGCGAAVAGDAAAPLRPADAAGMHAPTAEAASRHGCASAPASAG